MRAPVAPADPVVERLQALAHSSPDLQPAAQVYAILWPIVRQADLQPDPVSISLAEARAKFERDIPLLQGLDLALDQIAGRELLLRLAAALAYPESVRPDPSLGRKRHLPWGRTVPAPEPGSESHPSAVSAPQARLVERALAEGKLDAGSLLAAAATDDREALNTLAHRHGLDSDLLWTLAQLALRPALAVWAAQLAPLAVGLEWRPGYCYVCGAGATLAELQGNDQTKHLRCGRCGSDWLFRRLQCMYCRNTDHHTLGYLCPEGQLDKWRVDTCERCRGYGKVISSFSPTPPELLLVQDLATLHLDYLAQRHGYARVRFE